MDNRQERRDKAFRKRTRRALALTLVVGVALLVGFDLWLRHLLEVSEQDPAQAMLMARLATSVILLAIVVLLAVLGQVLLGWSRQTLGQGQWPPAGLQLSESSPVRHGEQAAAIARRLAWAGRSCWVLAALLAAVIGLRWMP